MSHCSKSKLGCSGLSRLNRSVRPQHLHKLEPDIRESVIGNAGTAISFRPGARDVVFTAGESDPVFDQPGLLNLSNHRIRLKLMIDRAPSKPLSATTMTSDKLRG
jgi:hypothetical protein